MGGVPPSRGIHFHAPVPASFLSLSASFSPLLAHAWESYWGIPDYQIHAPVVPWGYLSCLQFCSRLQYWKRGRQARGFSLKFTPKPKLFSSISFHSLLQILFLSLSSFLTLSRARKRGLGGSQPESALMVWPCPLVITLLWSSAWDRSVIIR